jgi:hypothetical protein
LGALDLLLDVACRSARTAAALGRLCGPLGGYPEGATNALYPSGWPPRQRQGQSDGPPPLWRAVAKALLLGDASGARGAVGLLGRWLTSASAEAAQTSAALAGSAFAGSAFAGPRSHPLPPHGGLTEVAVAATLVLHLARAAGEEDAAGARCLALLATLCAGEKRPVSGGNAGEDEDSPCPRAALPVLALLAELAGAALEAPPGSSGGSGGNGARTAVLECVDDDDDDDDDDEAGEEPVLDHASHVCSFVATGAEFAQQHWYNCFTCGLHGDKGCCGACARNCHAGHDLQYAKFSAFFCDCGSGDADDDGCGVCRCNHADATPYPAPAQPTLPVGVSGYAGGGSTAMVLRRRLAEPQHMAMLLGVFAGTLRYGRRYIFKNKIKNSLVTRSSSGADYKSRKCSFFFVRYSSQPPSFRYF